MQRCMLEKDEIAPETIERFQIQMEQKNEPT